MCHCRHTGVDISRNRSKVRIKARPHNGFPIIRHCSSRLSRLPSRSTFSARTFLTLLLLGTIVDTRLLFSEGFSSSSSPSSSSSSSSPSEPSPWASSSWLLKLDFGGQTQLQGANNEETPTPAFFSNTSPFSSYGASGSRLVVTCPVVVEAEDDANNKKVPDAFIGRGASVIRARDENDEDDMDCDDCVGGKKKNGYFTYITMEGSRQIEFSPGGWTLQFPPGGKANRGRASKLVFYVDLTTDLKRNDVALPAKTRLYFAASAWRELDYETGLAKIQPLQVALKQAQKVLDESLSHETGDRRLDGKDPIETLKAYGDMTGLILDRDRKRMALRAALDQDGHGYPGSDDHPEGPWPGTTEWLTLSEDNPIYARVPEDHDSTNGGSNKSSKNVLQKLLAAGGEKKYHYGRVGTWTGEAISSLLLDEE